MREYFKGKSGIIYSVATIEKKDSDDCALDFSEGPDSIIDCQDESILEELVKKMPNIYKKVEIPIGTLYLNEKKGAWMHIKKNSKDINSIRIPEGTRAIGSRFFEDSLLSSVEFPSTIEYIGDSAFRECKNISDLVLPRNLTHIGDSAFFMSGLTSINIEDTLIDSIGDFAFTKTLLSNLKIPKTVSRIGNDAFYSCKNLSDVDFSDCENLSVIYDTAFASCNLTSIDLSNCTLDRIGVGAFAGNQNLSKIKLPYNLKSLANNAFANTGVKNVKISESTDITEESGFFYDGKFTVEY